MSQFVVVGAGPVGLYVACLLAATGRELVVLDEGTGATGSRSIGIHPPALEALAQAGVADELLACGCRIESARLMLGADRLGDLSLRGCPGPYPFVLTLPQHETERILEARLEGLLPGALRRGARVVGVRRLGRGVELHLEDGGSVTSRFVIGCDGRLSRVREALNVPLEGGALNHHYLMADLPEDGALGRDAAIFLAREGVVESFPLPEKMRRWVARFPMRPDGRTSADLADAIERRTGIAVDPGNAPASAFTAEKRFARRLASADWALAGDAAHVISPIGGQGMNLGLLGGRALVEALTGEPADELVSEVVGETAGRAVERVRGGLAEYDRRQRARARASARRAGLNMFLGSERLPSGIRWAALRTVLLPGLQPRFARYFTMRGL